ncbi:MAG: T9SS type A sorting domain-containing protein [Dysgonamonadaceae bacterium]|nr:T9SS type A sorting domain-containing protein [Dysgonamonadaceae bacterium]
MKAIKLFLSAVIIFTAGALQASEPIVEISYIPPVGKDGIAEGRVVWNELTAENAEDYAVIALLKSTWGDTYAKPDYNNYLNDIDEYGNFFINITTGASDAEQPDCYFYLVLRSMFAGVDGSTVKAHNMGGRNLVQIEISRATFWANRLQAPIPNIQPGFVPAETEILLSASDEGTVKYTLDGSSPAESSTAQTYEGNAFTVPDDTPLLIKAVLMNDDKCSETVNLTYLPYTLNSTFFGLNVSLVLNNETFGSHLSEETARERLEHIIGLTDWIRTFGTTNNGLEYINKIAKESGRKSMIGLYITNDIAANDAQLAGLTAILQTNPAPDLIAVGNEPSQIGLKPAVLAAYIDSARRIVQEHNLVIPIGSVDTGNASWTQLVQKKLDFKGVNLYPGVWDTVSESQMFPQLKQQWQQAADNNPNLMLILTEIGSSYYTGTYSLPGGGTQTASEQKAAKYLENVLDWMSTDSIPAFYFEAYDENKSGHAIEKHFGIFDENGEMHPLYRNFLTTSIGDVKLHADSPYPNPSSNTVFFPEESDAKLLNLQGMLLKQTVGRHIDISAYPSGVYMLRLNGNIHRIVKK